MSLALSPLLTVLDSVAKGVEILETAVGTGSEANTVSKGAANNVTTLQAIADSALQADLMSVFVARAANVKQSVIERALIGASLQRALDRHYGEAYGSLNAFLANQDARVHPLLRNIGFQIDAPNAFCPTAIDPVASFVVTGSGAGTFTAGTAVDDTTYGKAHFRVRTTTLIGAAAIAATLTLTKADGSSETKVVNLPGSTASGTEFDVGLSTDRYLACTSISITGGTAADAFKVISTVERTIAL
ncbi:MAG TPA: hypothetical protein VEA16_04810 [Vicinamibacterales bacterium]|nr:hypothetical protein [Vicinamibacterales bacterium]